MTAGRLQPAQVLLRVLKYLTALVFLAPFYISLVYSFKTKQEITFTGLAFPGIFHFENFTQGIKMSGFWNALANSTITTVPTVILITLICCMASYSIARNGRSRFFNAAYYLFLIAILIPFQSIMLPLYVDLKTFGLLNTRLGFILTKVGFQIAFTILIVTGFVKSVPIELEEAADIDGASRWRIFWRIVFPLLKPIVFTSVVLNSLYTWNDFTTALIVLQKTAVRTLPLIQYFFFGENSIQLQLAFAVFTLSMLPIVALYLVLQRYVISGITMGAVKG